MKRNAKTTKTTTTSARTVVTTRTPKGKRNPIVRLSAKETADWKAGGAAKTKLVRLFTIGARKLGTTVVVDNRARHVHTFAANPDVGSADLAWMVREVARRRHNAGKKKPLPLEGQVMMFPESLQQDTRQLHIPTTPEARREAAAHAAMIARRGAAPNTRRRMLRAGTSVVELSLTDAEYKRWKTDQTFRLRVLGHARGAARETGHTAIVIHKAHTLATLR